MDFALTVRWRECYKAEEILLTERRIYEKRNLRKSKAGSQGHVISDDIHAVNHSNYADPAELERVAVHLREGKTLTESRKLAAAEVGQ